MPKPKEAANDENAASDEKKIDTGGGAYIAGPVNVQGNFVGRDHRSYEYHSLWPQHLREEYEKLQRALDNSNWYDAINLLDRLHDELLDDKEAKKILNSLRQDLCDRICKNVQEQLAHGAWYVIAGLVRHLRRESHSDEKVRRLLDRVKEKKIDRNRRYRESRTALDRGNWPAAIELLKRLSDEFPEDDAVQRLLKDTFGIPLLVKLILNVGIVILLTIALGILIPFGCKPPVPSALCVSVILLLVFHLGWRWRLLGLAFKVSTDKSNGAKRALRQCALRVNRWLHPWRLHKLTFWLPSVGLPVIAVVCFLILPPRLEQPLHTERFSVQITGEGSRALRHGDELELAPGDQVLVEAKLDQDGAECTWYAVQGRLEATEGCAAWYTAPSQGTRDVLSVLTISPCRTRCACAGLHVWVVVPEGQ